MNQYLLSICYPAGSTQPPPQALEAIMKDVGLVNKAMRDAGAWVFAGGLHAPDTATVVRVQNGERLTTDGPFIESKEHIGGFCIIKAADLDAALDWAAQLSRAVTVPVEVRPMQYGH